MDSVGSTWTPGSMSLCINTVNGIMNLWHAAGAGRMVAAIYWGGRHRCGKNGDV